MNEPIFTGFRPEHSIGGSFMATTLRCSAETASWSATSVVKPGSPDGIQIWDENTRMRIQG